LKAVLVRIAFVSELNHVESDGGGGGERDDASREDGHRLCWKGSGGISVTRGFFLQVERVSASKATVAPS